MDSHAQNALHGWRATRAAGIVAAALLSGCECESDLNELQTETNASATHPRASDLYVDADAGGVTIRPSDAPLQAIKPPIAAAPVEGLQEWSRHNEHKSFDELSTALTDPDSNVRLDAAAELSRFDDGQAAVVLASAALYDQQPSVRTEALLALYRGGGDIHRPGFARALSDPDVGVRKAAISALENIGAGSSLHSLAIALKDRDASVRATAVDAIGEIGGDGAQRLLESALFDESAVVREAATERLEGTPSAGNDRRQ